MEDILAILLIFGGGVCIALAFSPLGRALADRLRHGKTPPVVDIDPAVYAELDQLRAEMSELQERVDFAERLLAKPGSPELPGDRERAMTNGTLSVMIIFGGALAGRVDRGHRATAISGSRLPTRSATTAAPTKGAAVRRELEQMRGSVDQLQSDMDGLHAQLR